MAIELIKATQAFKQHDSCDVCGKRSDGLMTCHYSHDDTTTKLCPDCIQDSGFCMGCGAFSAGISSFDFSDIPGYCENCQDEIRATCGDNEDDWDGLSMDDFDSYEDDENDWYE